MTKPTTELVISESLEGFIRSIPDDLRRRLSLHDCDRLYRLFDEELRRMREAMSENDGDTPAPDPGLAYSEAIRLGRSGAKP